MQILYITNHFSMPDQPGAPRPWQVARYFAELGHHVTVLTNRRHYLDDNMVIVDRSLYADNKGGKVNIIGIKTSAGRRKTIFHRILNYISFSLRVLVYGMRLKRIDLIVTGTPPILAPISGLLLGLFHNAFTVLEIRDFHPDKAMAIKAIQSNLIIKMWRFYESVIRKGFDHLVAVEPSTLPRLLQNRIERQKITSIPNGIDMEHLKTSTLPDDLEKQFTKHKNSTIVTYGGGMGIGNFLQPIFQAANICTNPKVVFFIFGAGEMKIKYQDYVRKNKLKNVLFYPLQSREIINEVFRQSSILIYSVRNNPFFNGLMTNKIFEYLASGRPIILSGRGEMANMISDAHAGVCVSPENPQRIVRAINLLIEDPSLGNQLGQNGKTFVLKNHLRSKAFNGWQSVLSMVK